MTRQPELTRRGFLHLSAVTAGGVMLTACGGDASRTAPPQATTADAAGAPTQGPDVQSPTEAPAPTVASDTGRATPIEATGNYKESPQLTALVEAGNMPPVAERLPQNPYVVPHKWVQPGKYGGHLQMGASSDWGVAHYIQESMYGHSPVRWLNDGLDIGPGLAESWSTNDDATEWTFNFREGLKWSDGKPWTTADIMFWWEDMVLDEGHPAGPPDEARSGKGTLATFKAVDDLTLQLSFDAPAPLIPDLVACWVKRGIGPADWMQPRHYMEQFHPKYNKQINPKSDWVDTFDQKKDFAINPECPTMTGWKLKSYKEGVNTVWERNPYYWCVDKAGNQLPYIDGITMTNVQNPEVLKLRFIEGKVDYVHGGHTPLSLADVSPLRQAEPRSKLEVRFWDSGSGTGSIFFFNYDFAEPKMRELIRNPKFRQALSHAYNREQVRKVVYFNQGELTTGTMSPKAIEFKINEEGRTVYQQWRDSYVKYDPELAKQMLDEVGVVDKNGDGLREMPGGEKLSVRLDFPAEAGNETTRTNELLARDWRAIGIDAKLNPLPPESVEDQWRVGKVMSKTAWEASDGPNLLVNPTWQVPIEPARWAPLEGTYYSVRGTPAENAQQNVDPYKRTPPRMEPEAGGPVEQLWKLYDQAKVETDPMKRHRLVWDITRVHIEQGPFFMGVVANYPRIVLVKEGLMNVPRREDLPLNGFVNTWIHPTPAVYDFEAYYWDDPEAHS